MKKLLIITAVLLISPVFVSASLDHNVSGWAWSENIGWISLNCTNFGCENSNYGVNIGEDGTFSGYGWSENIGWIDFSPVGPYPALPNYSAKLEDSLVSGWIRALSYGGGWDGWIKTSGSNYGISINPSNGEFSGQAWSDFLIGWVNTSGATYEIETSFPFNSSPEQITSSQMSIDWAGECSYVMSLPIFNWTYTDVDNDPVGTDPQTEYQIRIDNDTNFSVDSNGNPVLDADEYTCSGSVCLGGDSLSFSPSSTNWISWANFGDTYYWKVRVKDSNNNWSEWSETDSFSITIHSYPDPDFVFSPESPGVGEVVSFQDLSSCYNSENNEYPCKNNESWRYLWDFGDGFTCDSNTNSSCRGDVIHIYTDISDYTVSLQVTDDAGTCSSLGSMGEVETSNPLPDWQEVPPSSWIDNLLGQIVNFFQRIFKINKN